MPICLKCQAHFPNSTLIDGKRKNLQTRRFCLACSPYGQHNTRDLRVARPEGVHWCPRCQQHVPLADFYRRRDGRDPTPYCKVCTNRQAVERQQRLKKQAVEYKGGCCAVCGYDRYVGSLEFHHEDDAVKEFNLSHAQCTSFEKIKTELDKCVLLCANCHREEHARLKGLL
jgi:hypothetical protein